MRLIYEHPDVKITDMTTRFMDIRKRVFSFPNQGTKVQQDIYFLAGKNAGLHPHNFGNRRRNNTFCSHYRRRWKKVPNLLISFNS